MFELNADGGAGNDIVSAQAFVLPATDVGFNPQPEPPVGRFNVNINGGAGNDVLNAVFGGEVGPDSANLNVSMFGGNGDDRFTLLWDEEVWNALAFVDGGAGFDAGIFSPGVRHVRVERVA
jgi:hypothetical protein